MSERNPDSGPQRRRPYLTKVWVGKHWRYVYTRRCYRLRYRTKRPHFGIISYIRRP